MSVEETPVRLRDDTLSWREVGDEILAIDERTWNYFSVTGAGVQIWRELTTDPTSPAELAASLVATFGIEHQQAAQDVREFLADLARQDLLVRADEN